MITYHVQEDILRGMDATIPVFETHRDKITPFPPTLARKIKEKGTFVPILQISKQFAIDFRMLYAIRKSLLYRLFLIEG